MRLSKEDSDLLFAMRLVGYAGFLFPLLNWKLEFIVDSDINSFVIYGIIIYHLTTSIFAFILRFYFKIYDDSISEYPIIIIGLYV